jgi:lytic murein transglycosylase
VSRAVIDRAFAGLSVDRKVIAFDHRQRGTFKRKSFEEYARTRVVPARIKRATRLMQKHHALLTRVENDFGVPATLIMAIWTLESDNGTGDMGKLPVVRTIATLAHDCRRTELFQGELIAALQIVQRGDLPLRDLVGAFAGEIGQTQFLPSSYIKYGVDFDGNGHVDLRHSVPDVLASTANLLKANGWRAGQPFGEGTENFQVMREWNRSEVYRKTMVLMSEQLPPIR